MKQNKHTKLAHTNATTHFEISWDDRFQDPLFFHHSLGHKPSKLLLQPTPNYKGTWHKRDFTASTLKSHITQFSTLCLPKSKYYHLFSLHPKMFMKKSHAFLFLSSSTLPCFWLTSIKISMQIQPHGQKHKNIASTIAHKSTHSAHYLHTNKDI